MDVFSKFTTFVTINYDPKEEEPNFDDGCEFAVEVKMKNGDSAWYGPISFDDLTAFVCTLSESDKDEFVNTVKRGAPEVPLQ